VVRAKKFEVVSNKGKVKVIISSFRETGQISVLGEIYVAAEISADSLGRGFIRIANKLENSVLIESTIGGHGKISTYSINGKELIVIGATNNREGRIVQFNRAGKAKAAWPPR